MIRGIARGDGILGAALGGLMARGTRGIALGGLMVLGILGIALGTLGTVRGDRIARAHITLVHIIL